MSPRGTRGAYRREERAELPADLQGRLVAAAAAGFGTLEKLAKELDVPKSSVHYYRTGRLTLPLSVMERMLGLAGDRELEEEVRAAANIKDRTWANSYAAGVHREMCRGRLRLPTREELERDDGLRRKAAAIVSYVMAEGSVWIKHNRFDAGMVNITFADHETDLYEHFRSLCKDVFLYDIGPPQKPGNGARAIRGFICSRFIADWLVENGVPIGEKSATDMSLPDWVISSTDPETMVAAIQPWLDGEGSVMFNVGGALSGFCVAQSRHTDLDFVSLPLQLIEAHDRGIGRSVASSTRYRCTDVLRYVESAWKSRALCDVQDLSRRLNTRPTTHLSRLRLKDNGLWSAIWMLRYCRSDTMDLAGMGAILGTRKRDAIRRGK